MRKTELIERITRISNNRDRGRLFATWVTLAAITLIISAGGIVSAAEPPWLPDRSHQVEVEIDGATIKIRTTGADPYLIWRLPQPLDDDQHVLEFEYFGTVEINPVYGFFGPPVSEAKRFDLPDLTIAEGWQSYQVDLAAAAAEPIPRDARVLRIDLGMKPNVRVQIRNIRLRPPTTEEVTRAATASERRKRIVVENESIRRYLHDSFPLDFDVAVDPQWVTLTGTCAGAMSEWTVIEYPAHESIGGAGVPCGDQIQFNGNDFRVRIPRVFQGRDRLHSGWRIRQHDASGPSTEFLSARRYATSIDPSDIAPASIRPQPKSQKGLSGISRRGPLEDFVELGIHAVTLNLNLNQFVSRTDAPEKQRIDVAGPPVYFNHRAFEPYDELIDFARRHKMVVTAIVLIPRSKRTGPQSPLVHSESDGGVYTMPDLSSQRGAKIYATVLDRIAERYRNADVEPGGITNWIAHNEIDFHPVWTNMGRQPRELLTETYYRSMRMIHNAARAHNPYARVYASLTHHWVVPDDGQWKQLAPREVLETLDRYSEMEGDFAWGVAYHPYPQSLFAPVAWKDTNIRDDFDTPLITIQNLDVLGRFLQRAEMRDGAGQMRSVLLSEQGFHTDSYDLEAQNRQAGSLWYAMNKVESMPWIESFIYHRWIDHPNEGGLMLGLRTLPTNEHPHGTRKRAWYVYQAIGTDAEAKAISGLPTP